VADLSTGTKTVEFRTTLKGVDCLVELAFMLQLGQHIAYIPDIFTLAFVPSTDKGRRIA